MKRINMAGQQHGRLTVVKYTSNSRWECVCECGVVKTVSRTNLVSGQVQSCGCLAMEVLEKRNTTHGMAGSDTYRIWALMKDRCTNTNNKKFSAYGGRGIMFTPAWTTFGGFLSDMGLRPQGMTLERVDVDQGYNKQNCIWASRQTQGNNKRNTVWLTAFGETKSLMDWVRDSRCSVSKYTLRQRATTYKWEHHRAITEKPRGHLS
jgi:hypothetical protein